MMPSCFILELYFFSAGLFSSLLPVAARTPARVTSTAVPTTALPTLTVVETAASATAMTTHACNDKAANRQANIVVNLRIMIANRGVN